MANDHKGPVRRGWEWLGHLHLAEWLWTLMISAVNALGVGYAAWWTWATQWGYLPIYLSALAAFTLTIWIINGVLWLRRQARPSRARISFDYSYAMALEDIEFVIDDTNAFNTLELRPKFRNVANGPVKFMVEKIDIRIEDRIAQARHIEGVIPRATLRTIILNSGFTREAYDKFNERSGGIMEYIIKYGYPDEQYTRQVSTSIELAFTKHPSDEQGNRRLFHRWIIKEESDIDIR
jgi:hypothetical protein